MSSTRIFIRPDNDNDYDYFKKIEDQDYFRPIASLNHERVGNFRVHGKYVSTFHPGRRIPNEYYCLASEAMTLRSGRQLNYMNEGFCMTDLRDCAVNFDGTQDWRCLSVKKLIWCYENYYHIISTCYQLAKVYDVCTVKVREFVAQLEKSVKPVYKERPFTKGEEDGEEVYYVDHTEPMPERDTAGKYVFCNCRYTIVEGGKATDCWGHHLDEFLPKLRKLNKMYSKPHRIITDSPAFKLMNRKTNDDCRSEIFSFLKSEDIKGMLPDIRVSVPRLRPLPHRRNAQAVA
jgi:hypothetical protein